MNSSIIQQTRPAQVFALGVMPLTFTSYVAAQVATALVAQLDGHEEIKYADVAKEAFNLAEALAKEGRERGC